MAAYFLRRLGQSLLAVIAMAALVFVGVYAIGNPIDILISPDATENDRLQTIARLGLDRPLWEQFFSYFGNLLRGDFGNSFVFGDSAMSVILQRLPATMELALLALLLAIVIGVPLGVLAGLYPDSIGGRSIMAGSILGFSLPNFWQGLMLILIFGVYLGWLPSGGRGPTTELFGIRVSFLSLEGLKYMVLPSINLALFKMALVIRLARAGTREVMMQDYIKFARAKGLSRSRLVTVHVLKNIMIPIVTVLGLELGSMIAFAVITETVFSWPGMGKLLIDSINRLDRPVIVAYLMLIVVIFVIINFLVDLLYSALDPRVRLMQRGAQ
ncbi:ABC transporter permease [Bosea sp. (in: a-proteobacteria)]|uniref:ABC transporter permease n=1 Tax=Bosea sp. (in: a-proteobacteria) TaxID=1871050 RepID=UPI0026295260|nr:ABC transporter permease [Bosea sp. (in: a-proteobacteria)]